MGSEIITNHTVNNQTNCTSIKHLIYAFKSIIVLLVLAEISPASWNGVILMIDLINDPGLDREYEWCDFASLKSPEKPRCIGRTLGTIFVRRNELQYAPQECFNFRLK